MVSLEVLLDWGYITNGILNLKGTLLLMKSGILLTQIKRRYGGQDIMNQRKITASETYSELH